MESKVLIKTLHFDTKGWLFQQVQSSLHISSIRLIWNTELSSEVKHPIKIKPFFVINCKSRWRESTLYSLLWNDQNIFTSLKQNWTPSLHVLLYLNFAFLNGKNQICRILTKSTKHPLFQINLPHGATWITSFLNGRVQVALCTAARPGRYRIRPLLLHY